jgi:hypothetical protein
MVSSAGLSFYLERRRAASRDLYVGSQTLKPIEDERASFERWYEADAMPLEHSNWFEKDGDGDYEIDHVMTSWRAWIARARQQ